MPSIVLARAAQQKISHDASCSLGGLLSSVDVLMLSLLRDFFALIVDFLLSVQMSLYCSGRFRQILDDGLCSILSERTNIDGGIVLIALDFWFVVCC